MFLSGKLIRDRVPEIIRGNGNEPIVYQADPQEYRQRLLDKLCEEAAETHNSPEENIAKELADILEVIRALAFDLGITVEQLEQIRIQKADTNGEFNDRIIWLGNK